MRLDLKDLEIYLKDLEIYNLARRG